MTQYYYDRSQSPIDYALSQTKKVCALSIGISLMTTRTWRSGTE
ncbi:hypothetical protein [Streptococcus equi]